MYDHILVPVDGSDAADRGLHEAIRLATGLGSKLTLLHAVGDFPFMNTVTLAGYDELTAALDRAGRAVLERAAAVAGDAGVACETILVEARLRPAWQAIVEQAAHGGCSLVVMGTHGWRGLDRLTMGSDAEMVVRHSSVPVLLVRCAEPS